MNEEFVAQVFGIDFEQDEVVMFNGARYAIADWYNPLGNKTGKAKASACVFQGPRKMWFAVYLDDYLRATVRH
jgi:hypothetical protein